MTEAPAAEILDNVNFWSPRNEASNEDLSVTTETSKERDEGK